ncbi:MAG: hypothetical protein ACXABY_09905 [Candidatus Thorarchaeota archaeon]|jgi:hypothetical protein
MANPLLFGSQSILPFAAGRLQSQAQLGVGAMPTRADQLRSGGGLSSFSPLSSWDPITTPAYSVPGAQQTNFIDWLPTNPPPAASGQPSGYWDPTYNPPGGVDPNFWAVGPFDPQWWRSQNPALNYFPNAGPTQLSMPGATYSTLNSYGLPDQAPISQPGTFNFQQQPGYDAISQNLQWLQPRMASLMQQPEDSPTTWQEWNRLLAMTSMGAEPGVAPLDPIVQLQRQLQSQYNPQEAFGRIGNFDINQALGFRQQNLNQQLQRQAAGMGVQGAYRGLMGAQGRAQNALAMKTQAGYDPAAYQMQQQYQQQIEQLWDQINRAELESRLTMTGAGL